MSLVTQPDVDAKTPADSSSKIFGSMMPEGFRPLRTNPLVPIYEEQPPYEEPHKALANPHTLSMEG